MPTRGPDAEPPADDPVAVAVTLAANPAAADRPGGVLGWDPLPFLEDVRLDRAGRLLVLTGAAR